MISINKLEATAIRKNFPDVYVVRTMRQKSKRGRYFCKESGKVTKFLKSFRKGNYSKEKAGDENRRIKKA